jgi:hypothetical protein
MIEELRPNNAEKEFLTLAYNKFFDIYEEIISDSFWDKDNWYRFCKIKDAFSIYAELLNYTPIKWVIESIKKNRPPMEAEIGRDLFKFIRNVITHYPFFESWDDVWVSKNIINWHKEGQFIDKFLNKYQAHDPVKYRFWESENRKMTYISINFPKEYTDNKRMFLKDILSEKNGVKFSVIFMKKILDTQVEK